LRVPGKIFPAKRHEPEHCLSQFDAVSGPELFGAEKGGIVQPNQIGFAAMSHIKETLL
jgi:hypothetical protein